MVRMSIVRRNWPHRRQQLQTMQWCRVVFCRTIKPGEIDLINQPSAFESLRHKFQTFLRNYMGGLEKIDILRLDGLHGEGVGQVLRTALSLSAITAKEKKMTRLNIRN
jgi:hypothetical protein